MAKVVTLGEIMLRLATPGHLRIIQSDCFEATYAGGEANVAVSLANYGHDAAFVSKVPTHAVGEAAVNSLRRFGVDTSKIIRGGQRLGIYFLETGASVRPSNVVYDRADSAIAQAQPEDFDFDAIFEGVDWFHWTGITPALGTNAQEVILKALQSAKKNGVTVSVDLNFRKKLWTSQVAQSVMKPLMSYVDYCIGNEEDAELVLGVKPGETNVEQGDLDTSGYESLLKTLVETYDFKAAVTTLRESHSASRNGWSAMAYDGDNLYSSEKYDLLIVDRVGGGDSFAGGFIHGILAGKPVGDALEFAVAASALKHTISGDFNLVSEGEVERLAGGDKSGRVQR